MSQPVLQIVSVPIGNREDITLRALNVLKNCDFVIGEEYKEASSLLKFYKIEKKIELLNEHSKSGDILLLLDEIKKSSEVCLISDSGSPTLEDPGSRLIELALESKIAVTVVPGASALTAALSLSGFNNSPFTFAGFLSREDRDRESELKKLLSLNHAIVIYETPYRYKKIIHLLAKLLLDKSRRVFLGLSITGPDEFTYRGQISGLVKIVESLPKLPPVIIIEGKK
ncbi:MAG: 16S rRNA methyltransferase [Leptospira sp.]|nr:16S rRNA methyltransferase [Leptospira sp.]